MKSWQVELKVSRLHGVYKAKLASCENMPDYESSHLVSYHELAVWGFVNRFMKSKLHVDINEKSFISKT